MSFSFWSPLLPLRLSFVRQQSSRLVTDVAAPELHQPASCEPIHGAFCFLDLAGFMPGASRRRDLPRTVDSTAISLGMG